jgi:hypothetical protein
MDPEAQAELLLVLQAQVQNLQADAATAAAAAAADALAAAGALQDAIDAAAAANAAAAAAAAVAAGGGLLPPPAPVFTLAPALANNAAYIDLTPLQAVASISREQLRLSTRSHSTSLIPRISKSSWIWS